MISLPAFWPIVFLLGAAVGSFLNVVILRTHAGASFVTGRSACPQCKTALRWWELLPVVSFVFLRGQCRTCRAKLSYQYIAVEILTGLLFMIVWASYYPEAIILAAWVVVAAMILIAVYDARWSVIPDGFTMTLAASAAITSWWIGNDLIDILLGGIAGGIFFGLQYLLSRKRWVGSGDILLGVALGLLLTWRWVGLGLMVAYMIGALVAAALLIFKRAGSRSAIAFGPYLLLGGFVTWIWGEQLVDLYFQHAVFR